MIKISNRKTMFFYTFKMYLKASLEYNRRTQKLGVNMRRTKSFSHIGLALHSSHRHHMRVKTLKKKQATRRNVFFLIENKPDAIHHV